MQQENIGNWKENCAAEEGLERKIKRINQDIHTLQSSQLHFTYQSIASVNNILTLQKNSLALTK